MRAFRRRASASAGSRSACARRAPAEYESAGVPGGSQNQRVSERFALALQWRCRMSGYWETLVAGAYSRADSAALYDPGRQHAPTDRGLLRAAALELRSRGLTPLDIGAALRLPESAVRALLEEAT